MIYIKLTAKPDTWFKEGTEVFVHNKHNYGGHRPTKEEQEQLITYDSGVFVGARICQLESELSNIGVEYDDGELCPIEEFNTEEVIDSNTFNR